MLTEAEDQTLKYATNLMSHIRVMFAYLDTYKALCERHKMFHNTMIQAPVFFNVVEKSLVSSLMIDLCKLFEESPDVLSVKKLYNICEQNLKNFSKYRKKNGIETDTLSTLAQALKAVKKDFECNKEVIANLKSQRDTLWAHHDKRWILTPSKMEEEHPIMWEEIEKLLRFASDFSNSVILNFTSGVEFPFFNSETACSDNVQTVLCLMENGIEKRRVEQHPVLSQTSIR